MDSFAVPVIYLPLTEIRVIQYGQFGQVRHHGVQAQNLGGQGFRGTIEERKTVQEVEDAVTGIKRGRTAFITNDLESIKKKVLVPVLRVGDVIEYHRGEVDIRIISTTTHSMVVKEQGFIYDSRNVKFDWLLLDSTLRDLEYVYVEPTGLDDWQLEKLLTYNCTVYSDQQEEIVQRVHNMLVPDDPIHYVNIVPPIRRAPNKKFLLPAQRQQREVYQVKREQIDLKVRSNSMGIHKGIIICVLMLFFARISMGSKVGYDSMIDKYLIKNATSMELYHGYRGNVRFGFPDTMCRSQWDYINALSIFTGKRNVKGCVHYGGLTKCNAVQAARDYGIANAWFTITRDYGNTFRGIVLMYDVTKAYRLLYDCRNGRFEGTIIWSNALMLSMDINYKVHPNCLTEDELQLGTVISADPTYQPSFGQI